MNIKNAELNDSVDSSQSSGSDYVVELQPQVQMWLASWGGDPGRTCVLKSAKRYKSERGAKIALGIARRFSPFRDAKIYQA